MTLLVLPLPAWPPPVFALILMTVATITWQVCRLHYRVGPKPAPWHTTIPANRPPLPTPRRAQPTLNPDWYGRHAAPPADPHQLELAEVKV